ncbi:MAG: ATP-dependent sacrificial sulfur transferase LarE [Filifactoraceae bacterium]
MYFVYCDGGSRGNPGKASIGVVIKKNEETVFTLGEYIGIETNNVAEYKALIKALTKLEEMKVDENIKIHLDSELVVKQINGKYKVKNLELQQLFSKAVSLITKFKNLEILHVRREFNKEADALVNIALDNFEKNGILENTSVTSIKPRLPMSILLQNKVEKLKEIINNYDSMVVGYSGGIDSSLLSYVASRILGEKAIALIIVGAQSIGSEIEYARNFAKTKKIKYIEIPVSIFENQPLMKNDKERCYYCKLANFRLLKEYSQNNGYAVVADGGNVDDLSELRPGLKAIKELDIKSPFVEAGFSKQDIKDFSEYLGLGFEKRGSNTCLITRLSINSKITEIRLRRVDICEDFLKSKNYNGFRVRDLEDIAVIEFMGDINISNEKANEISIFFKQQGYKKIYIDMEGYKIGSMSEKE